MEQLTIREDQCAPLAYTGIVDRVIHVHHTIHCTTMKVNKTIIISDPRDLTVTFALRKNLQTVRYIFCIKALILYYIILYIVSKILYSCVKGMTFSVHDPEVIAFEPQSGQTSGA